MEMTLAGTTAWTRRGARIRGRSSAQVHPYAFPALNLHNFTIMHRYLDGAEPHAFEALFQLLLGHFVQTRHCIRTSVVGPLTVGEQYR